MLRPRSLLVRLALAAIAAAVGPTIRPAAAQDNILIYGNSIIDGPTADYLHDLIVQTGAPAPNLVTFIIGNGTTGSYVNNQGLITSSLPAGQTWKAMIVQGGTLETTNFMGNVVAFQANMLALSATFFGHSPQGLFVGHETGADHPNSNRYPSWFPDAAAWLAFPQAAYAEAAEAITAAHPSSPPVHIAHQGTCWANTVGYGLALYRNDLHHLTPMGEALCACLYFVEIYGGRIEDIPVDFGSSTPLVNQLLQDGITEAQWDKVVGYADRSQPRELRPYPGTDSDFQMRIAVGSNATNLRVFKNATAGESLHVRLFSPLEATEMFPAGVYVQLLPTGALPTIGAFPGLQLDRSQLGSYFAVADLTGAPVMQPIPGGMAGTSMWLQATSRGPTGSSTYPLVFSDAQVVTIQ